VGHGTHTHTKKIGIPVPVKLHLKRRRIISLKRQSHATRNSFGWRSVPSKP